MGYDPFLPLTATRINVLCLPVHRIKQQRLYELVACIHNAAIRHLQQSTISVTPNSNAQDRDQPELPSTPRHALAFSFGLQSHAASIRESFFWEPNRDVQLVLGIFEDSDEHDLGVDETNTNFAHHVGEIYPSAFCHALAVVSPSGNAESEWEFSFDPNDEASCLRLIESLSELFYSSIDTLADRVMNRAIPIPLAPTPNDRLNGAERRRDSAQSGQSAVDRNKSINAAGSVPAAEQPGANELSEARRPVTRGILNLQRGLLPKALDQLADGARRCRDIGDQAWHARALEVMVVTMLLHLWFDVPFSVPQDCYPRVRSIGSGGTQGALINGNRSSVDMFLSSPLSGPPKGDALANLLPGLISSILDLYDRTNGPGESLPSLLVCEAKLRLANLSITAKQYGSALSRQTLAQLILNREASGGTSAAKGETLRGPDTKSSALANILIDIVMEAQARLSLQDCIAVFIAACDSLSKLHLNRKQGFLLKELLQKMIPAFIEARRMGAAEAKFNGGYSSTDLSSQPDHLQAASGLQSLLRVISSIYGLPDAYPTSPVNDQHSPTTAINERLSSWLAVFASGDIALKIEVMRLCIRATEAFADVQGGAHFMSLLLRVCKQAVMVPLTVPPPVPLIAPEEQGRLLAGIKHASSSIASAQYWDDFLVRNINPSDSPSGQLMSHTSQDLSMTTASGTGKKDPFIYNPFSDHSSKRDFVTLVRDEIAGFDVLLQNPLEMEIEIDSIMLATEGVDFEPARHSAIIPPLCIQTITLQGKPRNEGELEIIGCIAEIKGCRKQTFYIFPNVWAPPHLVKRRRDTIESPLVNAPSPTVQKCKIVSPLPQLELRSQPQSLMLLDGESRTFKITLENISTSALPADLLLFTYNDTITSGLQDALANSKDMPPADVYEAQHALSLHPTIRRVDREAANIQPGRSQTFTFEVYGKPGLTKAEVCIDYTYLGKERKEVEGTFWTRQIQYVLDVTVCGSVDIARCAIVNVPPNSVQPYHSGPQQSGPSDDDSNNTEEDCCLLQLDLRNMWPNALTVSISTKSAELTSNGWTVATTASLTPGNPTRTLVPIPKLRITDPHAVIPSLDTKRQFVVSASKLSLEAELEVRESFWYREKLCSMLKIEWVEDGEDHQTKRQGELDIRRGIRLTPRMIDAIKSEEISFTYKLLPAIPTSDTEEITQTEHSSFNLKRSVFANLIVTITNLSQEDLHLVLRLQPSIRDQPHSIAMDLSKKLIWTGTLQQALHGALQPNASYEYKLGLVGLVEGRFEVSATVEELRANKKGSDILLASGESDANQRRLWHATRPCRITVVE